MFPTYIVIKFRLIKIVAPVGLIAILFGLVYIVKQNRYLEFTPTTNTVTQVEFDDLLESTLRQKM
ncbi:MAG: hypothetical protein LRY27_01090 [Chitinophagales bacterium]|nr:hypothetical protein [Chitinophagales bacterium]